MLKRAVTQGAVSQWLQRAAAEGEAALRDHPARGAAPRLSTDQHALLAALLLEGAEAHGVRGEVWTTRRVAQLIQAQFEVSYHPDHVGRLLQHLGFSPQRPLVRATQRDEQAITAWQVERWSALKKGTCGMANHRLGRGGCVLLAGGVVRRYAPQGHTPVLHVPLTREHLAVISGITASGRLLVQLRQHTFKGLDIVRFLNHLQVWLGEKLLIIWDGLPAHKDGAVQRFLAESPPGWIQVEQLPSYAPDLTPDEGVWKHLKYVELQNVTCHNQDELRQELRRAIARLRQKPDLIRGFIEHYGY